MSENESNRILCVNGTVTHRNLRGLLHREDGPAVERANGSKDWYLCNIALLNEVEFKTAVELLNRDREVEHARTKACNDCDFHLLEGGRYVGLYHFESGSMVNTSAWGAWAHAITSTARGCRMMHIYDRF